MSRDACASSVGGAKPLRPGDHLGAERLLRLLQVRHRLRARSAGARPGRPRRRAAARASRRCGCRASRARRAERIDTGTSARSSSPSVRTPRLRSQRPSAPATTASTTSLTVPPSAFLIALKSASRLSTHQTRRCGPIGTLSGTSGAGFSPAHTTSPMPSAASRSCSTRAARAPERAEGAAGHLDRRAHEALARPRPPARPPTARARASSRPRRLRLGRHGGEVEQHGRDVHARDAVHQRVVRLRDQREAVAPRGPGRSTAPRAASSGRAAGRRCGPASSRSCSSLPGRGSAVWRTW